MRDRFTEAEMELQDKSPFVCVSCGHPHDIARVAKTWKTDTGYHDRFSEAVTEEAEKSAFTCESCGMKQEIPKRVKH